MRFDMYKYKYKFKYFRSQKTQLIDNLINTLSSFLLLARPHGVFLLLFRRLGAQCLF